MMLPLFKSKEKFCLGQNEAVSFLSVSEVLTTSNSVSCRYDGTSFSETEIPKQPVLQILFAFNFRHLG